MVTASPTKNVRPAKGGFRPKARFGLKPKEAPENGASGNGVHHKVSPASRFCSRPDHQLCSPDPVLTSPPLVAIVPQQENGDANGANGAVHDDVGALHGVMSPSEPKVMIPYKTKPGEVPRQVQIERKKRLFALQDISKLLGQKDVDLSDNSLPGSEAQLSKKLKIETFDNTTYETRNQKEWCPQDKTSTSGSTRATALRVDEDGFIEWVACSVVDTNEAENTYLVRYDGSDEDVWQPRMYICFKAEDPFLFANRVEESFKQRELAKLQLRYNFFIDNMPTEDIPPLTNEQVNRVLVYALNSKKLKDKLMDTSQLINEVNIDFARTMNKLIFDKINKRDEKVKDSSILSIEDKFPIDVTAKVPESGTFPIPLYDFPDQFSEFSFHTFLTKPEVISAIVKVKSEGLKIQKMNIFNIHYTKSSKLQEFEQAQGQATDQVSNQVKDTWILTLKNLIRSSFKDVGKGWFNLNEQNQETYEFSKLKKFLRVIRFMMEDTLRILVESSYERFVTFIEAECNCTVDIVSPATVVVEKSSEKKRKVPLFSIELAMDMEKFCFHYSTPLDKFLSAILKVFEQGVTSLQGIPSIEPSIMENLFWGSIPILNAVHPMEPKVVSARDALEKTVKFSLVALESYLKQYEKYNELLELDVNQFCTDLSEREDINLDLLKKTITESEEYLAHLKSSIPSSIVVGSYMVHTNKVREFLISKQSELIAKVKDVVVEIPKKRVREICQKYEDIDRKLKVKTQKPEDVDDMRRLMETVPSKNAELREEIQSLNEYYACLHDMRYNLSESDSQSKFVGSFWGVKIERLLQTTTENMDKDQERYEEEMDEEQESFQATIETLTDTVEKFSQYTDLSKVDYVYDDVQQITQQLKKAQDDANLFNRREGLFQKPITDYSHLQKVTTQFEPFQSLWKYAAAWKSWENEWMTGIFIKLDPEEVDKSVNMSVKSLHKTAKAFTNKGLDKCAENCNTTKAKIEDFMKYVPMIAALRNPGMRDRHWEQIGEEIKQELNPDESFTLKAGLEMGIMDHEERIIKIADVAGKEFSIEQALDKMQDEWSTVELELKEYRETGTYVVKVDEVIIQQLDDHIVMSQSMSFSPYKKPFEERITNWEQQLSLVSEVIDEWIQLQRQWMYLEPIFNSEDIQHQLPLESKRFSSVDRMWRKTLQQAYMTPHILTMCSSQKLLESYIESNKMLDSVQKGLADYLETKRLAFARFFFLSNDELLQILSQTKNPLAVQPHLRKCFEAISTLDFADDLEISAMNSGEGERIPFDKSMYPKGNVENWLGEVEERMKASVRMQTEVSIFDYAEKERTQWVRDWPAMVVLSGSAIHWSQGVEKGIKESALKEFQEKSLAELYDMTALVRGKLSKLERMTLGALITIDVHARDVVQGLVDGNIGAITDFEWVSQLRYYWKERDGTTGQAECWVEMVQASICYGYEYLGNSPRLVITPLTDRCYMTLMSAMHINLGGAPAGPAGTGKTETTKDLAKAMAKQCVVFNCSDGLDYIAMGKFFKGLASSGAWACFDEFNRIDLEVLSVIAQQILTIQLAIQQKVQRFIFEDTEIGLNPACNVYITMNPGYAGRSELPDNLKALFRPCAMMVPDYSLIGEICLYSFGYQNAKALAKKMVATFKLCSEQLSSQDHYDYGMRAVKSVITAAGNLKRDYPEDDEEVLLLRGLKDVNVPKFLSHDLPLFDGIISDLFPGVQQPKIEHDKLIGAIHESCRDLGLQPVDSFVSKIIQLYETTLVRHGLMLVGPTMGGKTSNWKSLSRAMTKLAGVGDFQKVRVYPLNPKSITMGQLYGEFDDNTHEWTDGVLACYMRECSEDTKPDKKWIMFDGPVDAIWIENMNTVLDDNKKLCLVSGEIIQLSSAMTMMFEVEDLAVASPATVSRCGMIYVEPTTMGFTPLLDSWIETLPEFAACKGEEMKQIFLAIVPDCIYMVRKQLKETVTTTDNNLVTSIFKIMSSMLKPFIRNEGEDPLTEEVLNQIKEMAVPYFIFSIVWSVGCSCDAKGRVAFDKYFREKVGANKALISETAMMPTDKSVYHWCWDQDQMKWVGWMDTIPEFKADPDMPFAEMVIPTIDTVRYGYVVNTLARDNRHVLCVGDTGTGKTLIVSNKLMTGMPKEYIPIFMTFSARTSANQTQDQIDARMEKRRKGVFGPPTGKKYVFFIDDLNMPLREKYFAQPPIEVVRQWMDYSGWYDRKPPCAFRQLIDMQFIAAMGPPGGGRNPVTNRLLRHFNFISFTDMAEETLCRIFETILSSFVSKYFGNLSSLVHPIITSTVEMYNTVRTELLPTPSKSHYTFNLRDLGKVFQGTMRANPKAISDEAGFICLWLHELQRVFKDRLINNEDREWFLELQKKHVKQHMNMEWEDTVQTESLIFGDYFIPGADPQIYQQITDMDKLINVINEYLEDYNSVSNAPMNLVMFLDAIEHVSRVCRVIGLPLGNALLLGVGGSGRQSLTKLAASIEDYQLFQIEISKQYGQNEWRDDLKTVLKKAGMDGENVVFLFTDTQIVKESFLEDINNILNSGEVPNLWGTDDQEQINGAMRPLMQQQGIQQITKPAIASFFTNRVRSNLHVVLCFSPVGDVFRQRLRMFPALVNCCTIDWFAEWPREALASVCKYFMTDVELGEGENNLLEGVVNACVYIHQSVEHKSKKYLDELRRHNYVTPTSYLELLGTFLKVLGEKKDELGTVKTRLSVGLDKLNNTTKEVEKMKEDLRELQPVLVKTQKEVDEMMIVITKDKKEADETKKVVTEQEAEANEQAATAKAIKDDAEADLAKALPALDAALESLKNLSRADIVEVKALKNPPEGVRLVMEATCIMFEEKPKMVADPNRMGKKIPDYWENATKLLADPTRFLTMLTEFDKDNIKNSVITKIEPYMNNESFTPEAVARVNKACTSICMWARAMYTYHQIALQVEPKRAALKEAEAAAARAASTLAEAQASLREVEEKIAKLEADYDKAVAKQDELAKQVSDCKVKLDRAEKLIGGLGGERVRWTETVETLAKALINVIGDAVVSSGVIGYSGPFTPMYRQELVKEWNEALDKFGIPHTEGTNIISCLQDPVKVRSWNIAGLPSDAQSTENAIILSKARRWPLMIDPQGQANNWIKNMEKDRGLDVIKLSEKDYLRTLENGVRFGRAVLLENIGEELEAALEPLLLKQVFKDGSNDVIKIGDNVIPYHADFSFYMTTKLRNPHYSPEISVKVSILNFLVTPEGLEDQLLGIVVTQERPDLAEMKNQLVVSNAKMKKELKEIEDKILFLLSNSQGNILDDEELIDTLAKSKVTSNEISAKVQEAEKTEKEIDATRELYRPVAIRASLLFFCISDLALMDPMYQYSLTWYIDLFIRGIAASEASEDIEVRGRNLNDYFTLSLYNNICRSLFEAHKLLFSFTLSIKILKHRGLIDDHDWRFLLSGATSEDKSRPNPAPEWLTDPNWNEIVNLSKLPNFEGFADDFVANIGVYKTLFDSNDAHRQEFSPMFQEKLSPFQRLCVLKCIRADKVVLAIQDFISKEMGQQFIEPPAFDLGVCYKESQNLVPLIFVLSSGADPMADLLKFADEMKFSRKFDKVSLGQGQGAKAEKLLSNGMERGLWVCLQNCHLAGSWMPSLERILETTDPKTVHKDFRLWLTSMPSDKFPVLILQNGVKMTLEPPKGLKSNLTRSYNRITDGYVSECSKPNEFRKLMFGLCLFHAVIQDRRKFGPLGWNIRYGFTDGDLKVCQTQMKMFLSDYDEIPYRVLRFMCSEINYGGRVTDDKDRRLINNLLESFINENVLMEGYQFSDSGVYKVAEGETIKDYQDYIKGLPIVPNPEIFGLHENADITCDLGETNSLFATVLSIQPRVGGGTGLSREEVVSKLAQEILDKTPPVFDTDEVYKKYPTRHDESMNTVLNQECLRYNSLLAIMKVSLQNGIKALKGLVVMSPDLEAVTSNLFDNIVPELWAGKAYPSLKPLSSWVTDLIERVTFIQNWIEKGNPACYWISGFFFPQAFLTGTLQNFARKMLFSIDTVSFSFRVMDTLTDAVPDGPTDGCYIRGLYLEGGRWDYAAHVLDESRPKELYTEMPIIWLKPEQNRIKQEFGKQHRPAGAVRLSWTGSRSWSRPDSLSLSLSL